MHIKTFISTVTVAALSAQVVADFIVITDYPSALKSASPAEVRTNTLSPPEPGPSE